MTSPTGAAADGGLGGAPHPDGAPGRRSGVQRGCPPRVRVRVYDLEEARRFCSGRCLIASKALDASLPRDRPYGVPPDRLAAVVALVEGSAAGLGTGYGLRAWMGMERWRAREGRLR